MQYIFIFTQVFTIPSLFSNLPSGIIVFHPEEVDIEC